MDIVQRIVRSLRTMRRAVRRGGIFASFALILALPAGCTPVQRPAAEQAAAVQAAAPVTLRMAVPEDQGRGLTPYVLEFVDQVGKLSGGSIIVEPAWNPTSGPTYEKDLVQRVLDGDYDLAVAASRAWDDQNAASLHVLQAPFLITDDALAEAGERQQPVCVDRLGACKVERLPGQCDAGHHGEIGGAVHMIPGGIDRIHCQ